MIALSLNRLLYPTFMISKHLYKNKENRPSKNFCNLCLNYMYIDCLVCFISEVDRLVPWTIQPTFKIPALKNQLLLISPLYQALKGRVSSGQLWYMYLPTSKAILMYVNSCCDKICQKTLRPGEICYFSRHIYSKP